MWTGLIYIFQSTLPVWGATLYVATVVIDAYYISIHAPRVGSDSIKTASDLSVTVFQSTLPVWGATTGLENKITLDSISIHAPRVGSDTVSWYQSKDFVISIHAPRVGSDRRETEHPRGSRISIHAPRVGSDPWKRLKRRPLQAFQSTLPVWGATVKKRIFYSNFQFFSV